MRRIGVRLRRGGLVVLFSLLTASGAAADSYVGAAGGAVVPWSGDVGWSVMGEDGNASGESVVRSIPGVRVNCCGLGFDMGPGLGRDGMRWVMNRNGGSWRTRSLRRWRRRWHSGSTAWRRNFARQSSGVFFRSRRSACSTRSPRRSAGVRVAAMNGSMNDSIHAPSRTAGIGETMCPSC